MAKVKNSRLGRGLLKDVTGNYSIIGELDSFSLSDRLLTFVFVVYWDGNDGEAFKQSFVLVDDAGTVLDASPETNYVLNGGSENMGIAYFDATFRRAGKYFIKVYQDGACIETIPFDVIQPGSTGDELLQ